jgi:hypothetical protein
MTDDIIELIRARLSGVAREARKLKTRRERSARWRRFWREELAPGELDAWMAHMHAAHARWNATMSPGERAEQRDKISKAALAEGARSARGKLIWARMSPRKRKKFGAAVSAGLNHFWATASPERRKAQSAAANAAYLSLTHERRSAQVKAAWARRRHGRNS